VEEAAQHDLRFVGQLPLHLNYRDLAVSPSLTGALRSASDRRAWEHVKALATNEFFRRDVYVKGAVPGAENTSRAYLDGTPFGTLVPADQVKREVPLPNHALRFSGPLFDTVIDRLAEGSSTVSKLAGDPSLASFAEEAIRQAVLLLAMGGDVMPMARLAKRPGVTASRYRLPSSFNRAILAQPLSRTVAIVLASPVAGTGVRVSALHAVALRALTEARAEGRPAWIRGFVEATPLRLFDHGRELDGKSDLARALGVQIDEFRATRLPKFIELGIVETCPDP
jgi:hypothetical protein